MSYIWDTYQQHRRRARFHGALCALFGLATLTLLTYTLYSLFQLPLAQWRLTDYGNHLLLIGVGLLAIWGHYSDYQDALRESRLHAPTTATNFDKEPTA